MRQQYFLSKEDYQKGTAFFIGNEGLSIVENSAKAGLPVPEKLKATLEQLKEHKA